LTKSFVVLIIGNSKSNHLAVQGTFMMVRWCSVCVCVCVPGERRKGFLTAFGNLALSPMPSTMGRSTTYSGWRKMVRCCSVCVYVCMCVCVCVTGNKEGFLDRLWELGVEAYAEHDGEKNHL